MKTTQDYPARKTGGCLILAIALMLLAIIYISAQPKVTNEYYDTLFNKLDIDKIWDVKFK